MLTIVLLATIVFSSATPSPGTAQTPLTPRAYLPMVYRSDPSMPFGYGIQIHAYHVPEYVIGIVQDLGLTWIKQQVRWSYLEKDDDSYSWGEVDRIVDIAGQADLSVLLSVVDAPRWARGGQDGNGPPDDYQDFYDFMGVMAARYRGRVHAYEIWNEQNLSREWEGAALNAADYVTLLAGAHQAIEAADPEAIVVSGALAPTGINDGINAIDDRAYLEQMYDAGLGDACDAVGAHPYGFANPPEVYYTGGDYDPSRGYDDHPSFFFRNTLEDYYTIMIARGDDDKRIWATEFGWPTIDGMNVQPNPGYEYAADINQQQQADYIVRGYTWSAKWGHAGVLFLWNLNMWPLVGAKNEMSKFSILRDDWSPRPAYTALKAMPK
jgi:hypothetical protein